MRMPFRDYLISTPSIKGGKCRFYDCHILTFFLPFFPSTVLPALLPWSQPPHNPRFPHKHKPRSTGSYKSETFIKRSYDLVNIKKDVWRPIKDKNEETLSTSQNRGGEFGGQRLITPSNSAPDVMWRKSVLRLGDREPLFTALTFVCEKEHRSSSYSH